MFIRPPVCGSFYSRVEVPRAWVLLKLGGPWKMKVYRRLGARVDRVYLPLCRPSSALETMRSPSSSRCVSYADKRFTNVICCSCGLYPMVAMNTIQCTGKENTFLDCLMFNNRRLIQQGFDDERGRNASVELP